LVATSHYSADRIDLLAVSATRGIGPAPSPTISTSAGSGPDDSLFSPVTDTLAVALGRANRAGLSNVTGTPAPTQLPGGPLLTGTGPIKLAVNPQGTLLASANIDSTDVSVYASTAPPPAVTQILSSRATVDRGRVRLRVRCAALVDGGRGHPCHGALTLTLARDGQHLGTAALDIAPGASTTVGRSRSAWQ
jgi:DNA-binding beta-propeller fold protein YncE